MLPATPAGLVHAHAFGNCDQLVQFGFDLPWLIVRIVAAVKSEFVTSIANVLYQMTDPLSFLMMFSNYVDLLV